MGPRINLVKRFWPKRGQIFDKLYLLTTLTKILDTTTLKHNDTQHNNNKSNVTLSKMTLSIMAACCYAHCNIMLSVIFADCHK
jgi:hypothetical protein